MSLAAAAKESRGAEVLAVLSPKIGVIIELKEEQRSELLIKRKP